MPELPDLVHDRRGSGEPLVLIHGIGHRRQIWDPIVDDLATRYEVITLDLAGFGQSEPFPKGHAYSMSNACDHLSDQFAKWGIEKPHVVGNSLGGAIALELGARNLVSSVTALSPAGFFGTFSRFQALAVLLFLRLSAFLTPAFLLRRLSRTRVGKWLAGSTLYLHPQRHSAESTYGDAMGLKRCKGFERTALHGVTYAFHGPTPVPTTVAWGTHDRILIHSQSLIASERLPEAHHVDLPRCGHVPIADDPELVTRVIDQTIAEARAAKAA